MATMNPLEKKARTSFIKGLVVSGVIGILAAGLLGFQIFNMNGKEKARIASQKSVVILNQDVKSGEEVTMDMLTTTLANAEVATANAMTMASFGEMSTVTDNAGNLIAVKLIAKIDIPAKAILTAEMISTEEDTVTNDLREQEFNMIVLPPLLQTGDTIDIRLRLPNGTDYLVLAKKRVTLPELGGTVSTTSIMINVTEEQILSMSAAIVDAYQITGSKLYATKYTDPGLQAVATPTYVPSTETINMIDSDPNIVTRARNELISRYNATYGSYRPGIQNTINSIDENIRKTNVESQTSSEITTQENDRKKYLDSIYGEY